LPRSAADISTNKFGGFTPPFGKFGARVDSGLSRSYITEEGSLLKAGRQKYEANVICPRPLKDEPQQMCGNCSPTSKSTIRVPPKAVFNTIMPSFEPPIIAKGQTRFAQDHQESRLIPE
jgi:hypothetical protein